MISKSFEPLRQLVGEKLRLNEPLRRYTVARLGGPADALVVVDTLEMLEQVVRLAWSYGWPLRILGGGANILIGDKGFRGLVVINDAKNVDYLEDGRVIAESGAGMIAIARGSMEKGLAGFEWAINVPGTVGGGAVSNAGAHGSDVAHQLVGIEIAFKDQTIEHWPLEKLNYRYRESALKRSPDPYVVLKVELQLQPGHDPAILEGRADAFIAQRKRTQPPGASLGSMFKNPPGDYAGRLIEAAGLKGTRRGGVVISPMHGNFFINVERGTAADYLALIRLAQEHVQTKFGITLELEIELVGEFA
ncbi:MAG: UDP-N-acetylmuramate dehydrogenase [Anaerolineae bacterium]|nr:UDP-N-acetylmuramate dehydrogenase [Anaerolineae bacterium]